EGVIVALITPVDRDGRVDHGALRQLVERLVSKGVTGISPLGSTGEGYSLGLEQRLAVVDTVARAVPAGMPVIPGIFASHHEQAVAEIAAYAERGGTAVLAAPPSYYPMAPVEQEAYFARVADAAAVPLVLYNIPRFTKVQIAPSAVVALAAHPRIAGLKDSSGDLGYETRLLDGLAAAEAADFSVLTGVDSVLVGKVDDALRHEVRLRAVNAACGVGGLPAAFKAAVAATGIGSPWLVPPRLPLTDVETAALVDRLKALEAS